MGDGYRHFAGTKGGKVLHVGADTSVYMYQTLAAAVAAAQNNDVILVESGTYTLTTKLTIDKPLTIKGMRPSGDKGVIITGGTTLGSELVLVDLASVSATAEVVFEDIYFLGTDVDQQVVKIDNGSMGNYKLKVRFVNCILELTGSTGGYALYVAHTGVAAANEIQVKVNGLHWHKVQGVYFLAKDAQDAIEFQGVKLEVGGVTNAVVTSADDIGLQVWFIGVEAPHEHALSGGHATQGVYSLNSYSNAAGTIALLDTNDLIGSHTEAALLPVS